MDWHASATRLCELMDLGHNPFRVRQKIRAEQSEPVPSPPALTLLFKFMQSNRSVDVMFLLLWLHGEYFHGDFGITETLQFQSRA